MPGGNGKQIFGDCWWLDTEGEAVINPSLSDQSIQAYMASSTRSGGSRPLVNHLHTPQSVLSTPDAFRHDVAQVRFSWLSCFSVVIKSCLDLTCDLRCSLTCVPCSSLTLQEFLAGCC